MVAYNIDQFISFINLHGKQIAAGVVTGGLLVALGVWAKENPVSFISVNIYVNIYILEEKSGAVIEAESLEFRSMGPRYVAGISKSESQPSDIRLGLMIDRGFAVASEDNYTIKDTHNYAKLCLIKLEMKKNDFGKTSVILYSKDNLETLEFKLPVDFSLEPSCRFASTSIIGGKVSSVWDCGDEAGKWISKTLKGTNSGLRLVYHYSSTSMRTHSPKYLAPFGDTMREHHLPALSNVTPYHIVSQASVDELNRKIPELKMPVEALNFRPNIVVRTLDSRPYQEDRWKTLKIGQTILEFSLPDNRCISVNHNHRTSKRDDKILNWLKKNRRTLTAKQENIIGGKQGIFGHRYGLASGTEGIVRINDEVWVFMSRY